MVMPGPISPMTTPVRVCIAGVKMVCLAFVMSNADFALPLPSGMGPILS